MIAVVCVPSFVAGVMYSKPCEPVTLLNAKAATTENAVDAPSGAADPVAPVRIGQPAQWQTVGMHVTTDSDNIQPAGTFSHTQAQVPQMEAARIEAIPSSD